MNIRTLLFIVIFIEGYVVLASELLAIRLIVPWVGSGTEIISIVIAAVLLPLSLGYYAGGQYRKNYKGSVCSIRKKLLSNLKVSVVILTFGLSYSILEIFFTALYELNIMYRLLHAVLYAGIFLVYPVFLLGQTIPLISNYFSRSSLSEMTGKMLMISTLGSFCGSVISTVVLMSFIGVHYTVVFVILLLCLLILIINKKGRGDNVLLAFFVAFIAIYLNSGMQMKSMSIVNNNAYNTVQVLDLEMKGDTKDDATTRIMALNGNYSSSYKEGVGSVYNYTNYIQKSFIDPLKEMGEPKDILVVGAAGFTLGLNDEYNNYIFVDIDPDLKKITEKDFLQQKLPKNKIFAPVPARGFLTEAYKSGKRFDLIVLDVGAGGFTIPEHLLTKEYFQQVKKVSKDGGYIMMNIVTAGNFSGRFAVRLDNTLRSVFPHVSRAVMLGVGDNYNAWVKAKNEHGIYTTNVVYSYRNDSEADKDTTIYTDNKNTYFMDKY